MLYRLLDTDEYSPSCVYIVPTVDRKGQEYTHTFEPGLAGASIPRLAYLTRRTTLGIRVLWNLFFFVVVLCVVFGQRDYAEWNSLSKQGRVATAYISNKLPTDNISFADRDLCYEYVSGSETYTFDKYVSEEDASRAPSPITITYLPSASGKVYVEGIVTAQRRSAGIWNWAYPSVLVCGLCGLLAGGFTGHARERLRMLREGVAVTGVVLSGYTIQNGKSFAYRLEYTYRTGAQKHKGTMPVTEAQYIAYTQGNPYFTVLYDAAKPATHMPYFRYDCAEFVASTL